MRVRGVTPPDAAMVAATVQRFGPAFEASVGGMTLLDLDGRFLRTNAAMRTLLGRDEDALAGLTFLDLTHPDDVDMGEGYVERALAGEDRFSVEKRYVRPDGSVVWALVNITLLRTDEGSPICFFTQVLDITARVEAEQALARQVEFVRLLQTVTAAANSSSLEDALTTTLREVARGTGWVLGHAWLFPPDVPDTLVSSGIWYVGEPDAPDLADFVATSSSMRFASGVGLPGRVLSTRRPFWVEYMEDGPQFPRSGLAVRTGVRSGFACPVRAGSSIVGVLEFFSRDLRPMDSDLLALADHLGTQLGRLVERGEAERALRTGERRLREVLETATDAFVAADAAGRITEWNPQSEQLFGWTREEVLGGSLVDLLVPERFRAAHRAGVARFVAGNAGAQVGRRVDLEALRRDGGEVPVEMSLSATWEGGRPHFHAFLRDISDRLDLHRRLEESAHTDELTGLANRRGFLARADGAQAAAAQQGLSLALLWIDLDDMKQINDAYGHDAGDRALVAMADTLRATFRQDDLAGRLGGDEFCVLLSVQDRAQAESLRERLRETVESGTSERFPLRCSVGLAYLPDLGEEASLESLLVAADQAMYAEKRDKRQPAA